jgi:hypothetical protein
LNLKADTIGFFLIYKVAKKGKKPEFIGNFAVNINLLNRFADEKKTNHCYVLHQESSMF